MSLERLALAAIVFGTFACMEQPPPEPVETPKPTPKPAPQHVMDALKIRDQNRAKMLRPKPKPDLELLESSGSSNDFSTSNTGRIRNNTSQKYTYVQVLFNVFDSNQNRVGTALSNINNLGPGEVWKFKAIYFGTGGERFNLNKIEGY